MKKIEFPSIISQAKGIGKLYQWIGLYSIVLLTGVTVVSMTNIFTAGEFAQYPWIKHAWAFIFALAIDVNIVRLFIEARIERSRSAYIIGLGLAAVTGAALLIEGLQQSIGVQWSDQTVQFMIACLIGFRVLFVVVLMAREGYKLGKLIQQSTQEDVQPKQGYTPIDIIQEETPYTPLEIEQECLPLTGVNTGVDTYEQKIRELLERDYTLSARSLAKQAECTPATASKWKKQILNEGKG